MRTTKRLLLIVLMLMGCCGRFASLAKYRQSEPPAPVGQGEPWMMGQAADDKECRQWVDSVMATLSLKERVGQLFIYTLAPDKGKANRDLLRRVVRENRVGGLLFSGGELQAQAELTNEAQELADVPLLITFDGEWGLSMRLKNTPLFPRNMVLGCISDDSLIYAYGREVARQCRELGVQVNFAPVADVNVNPRNPVINTRSFGEDPSEVARKVLAYSRGLEEGGVLAVCKHFPGHGDTEVDSHLALPLLPFSRQRLDSVELLPFREAIRGGVDGIMVGHLEVPALEPRKGVPSSLSGNVVQNLLVEEMGFKGLVFTDALAMKGAGAQNTLCLQALLAGNDLLLVPRALKGEEEAVMKALKNGQLSEEVINRKCRKVLTYKYVLGLHRRRNIQISGLEQRINTPEAEALIRRLKEAAVTVLGNETGALPLNLAIGRVAVLRVGDEKLQAFTRALEPYAQPVELVLGKTLTVAERNVLRQKISSCDALVVALGEARTESFRLLMNGFRPDCPVVYACFMPGKELAKVHRALPRQADGTPVLGTVVLAHSAEPEMQQQVARLLYGEAVATGRLSSAIGDRFRTGEGSDLRPQAAAPARPADYGIDSRKLAAIDTIVRQGIREKAFPGCQVVVWKDGREVYNRAFGKHTYDGGRIVRTDDLYDLASLTKTTATLLAVMKLYDEGRISLTDYASSYLPWLRGTDKEKITLRQLLLHESGLPSTILFYREAIDAESYEGTLYKGSRDARHPVRIGSQTWANPSFSYLSGLTSAVATGRHTLQVSDSLWIDGSFREEYRRLIAEARLGDGRYRYSCVGFVVLQMVVESLTGLSLDEYLEREFYAPMGLTHTCYLPLRRVGKDEVVPSSTDPFLRHVVLQGFVHDETAAFQGGVSGNAGLFSTASEVAAVYQMLLNGGEWNGRRYLSESTCRLFTTSTSARSRRGLGFDRPDLRNPSKSPCAPSAPSDVYGHTGFTGTCAWTDPRDRLVYVFLCNRLYPDVWNTRLMRLDIRTRIQEAIYQSLLRPTD